MKIKRVNSVKCLAGTSMNICVQQYKNPTKFPFLYSLRKTTNQKTITEDAKLANSPGPSPGVRA